MAELNPYAPPKSELRDPDMPPSADELATTGQRFANYLLDWIGTALLGVVVAAGTELIAPGRIEALNNYLFGIVCLLLYYVPSESTLGRSPAKFVTGTRVVSRDGSPPGLARVVGRTFARMVPFEAFSFLGGDGRPVGWHDSWSKTRVIRTRPARRPVDVSANMKGDARPPADHRNAGPESP